MMNLTLKIIISVEKLNKYIDNGVEFSFLDYSKIFNEDSLRIKNDKNELNEYNIIFSVINNLRDIENVNSIYIKQENQ